LTLSHGIRLHHWGPPIEAPPAPVAPSTSTPNPAPMEPSATGSEAPTGIGADVEMGTTLTESGEKEPTGSGGAVDVPAVDVPDTNSGNEPGTNKEEEKNNVKTDSTANGEGSEIKLEISTPLAAPETNETPATTPAPAAPAAPVSIATKLPVHAWQYDEIVFSDPPLAFLNILNEHPPTPLPPKNRRPRDQREQVESTTKKKKGRVSEIRRSVSRAGTGELGAEGAEGEKEGVVGIVGEPGSADVPLEFSLEMQKAEWNKLQEARRHIIEEMDSWR
jgi:YEATS domain-containing protein 4